MINYRNVIAWIDRQTNAKTTKVFSLDTLNTLHRLTIQGLIDDADSGQFRKNKSLCRVQSAEA